MPTEKERINQVLNELPSIFQGMGGLKAAMRRCRRTDSPKYQDYDRRYTELENKGLDYISWVRMVISVRLGDVECAKDGTVWDFPDEEGTKRLQARLYGVTPD